MMQLPHNTAKTVASLPKSGKRVRTHTKRHGLFNIPASWSSGNAFVSGAGGLRFKSRAGQIGHSVADSSPPLRHFFERSCVARAQ